MFIIKVDENNNVKNTPEEIQEMIEKAYQEGKNSIINTPTSWPSAPYIPYCWPEKLNPTKITCNMEG